ERCERIVGNLRTRGAHRAQERALAGVGHADESDVGDEFEFKLEISLFAFCARLGVARGLVGGGFEMPVSLAALSTARDDDLLFGLVEIGQENLVVGVVDERAGGNADEQIVAGFTVLFFPHSALAGLGFPVMFAGEVEQRVAIRIGDKNNGATVATV